MKAVNWLGKKLFPSRRCNRNECDGEVGAEWYDDAYKHIGSYSLPYHHSHYYFIWCVIADRIKQAGIKRVLEVGCGSGQLAAFLIDQGVERYVGLDFSPQAVEMARKACPKGEFMVDDARTTSLHLNGCFEAIICTEVLEHVTEDKEIVARFSSGVRCLCTVPNFPYRSHVRHFTNATEVARRYGKFFVDFSVNTYRGHGANEVEYFLFDGKRV